MKIYHGFPNRLQKYPNSPIISILSRITFLNFLRGAKKQVAKQSKLKNLLPYPDECYAVWEACCGRKFLYDYLIDQVADNREKHKTLNLISKVMYFHGKKKFAAKLTGPSRIHYLNSIFPDARFVHIIRDGRAVVNSLMNVGFWRERGGYNKPWWENGLTSDDLLMYEQYKHSPLALAAIQWRRIIKVARDEASKISNSRYYELKYEDFINAPHDHIEKLFEFFGLENSKKVHNYIDKFSQLKNQNYKYLSSINTTDIGILVEIIGDLN